jgi:hypothetical protein
VLWSNNLSKHKGLPRPEWYGNKKFYFKDGKRLLPKKFPVPYQSMPGDEDFVLKLNIENEKEVFSNDLCGFCGIKIEEEDLSIRWMVEKTEIKEKRDLVPSDFCPQHLECMKQARTYCPFMKTLKDYDFEIKKQKNNLLIAKEKIEKYFFIKWEEKPRNYNN